jgi:hypothetical protein
MIMPVYVYDAENAPNRNVIVKLEIAPTRADSRFR